MNRRSPLFAQFSQEQRRREQQNQRQSQSQSSQSTRVSQPQSQSSPGAQYQSQPKEEINPLLLARASQLERERLQNTTLYNKAPPRRYSAGPTTPESPPFLHAPPNTPHTPPRIQGRKHSHGNSDIHSLSPSPRGINENAGWSWMSYFSGAFVVVLGVVLLGKHEDKVGPAGPSETDEVEKSLSASWGFGEVGTILVWVVWAVLAYICWWGGAVLYEAAAERVREREMERERRVVAGRRGGGKGREIGHQMRFARAGVEGMRGGREKGRRFVDESEDEYVAERKR